MLNKKELAREILQGSLFLLFLCVLSSSSGFTLPALRLCSYLDAKPPWPRPGSILGFEGMDCVNRGDRCCRWGLSLRWWPLTGAVAFDQVWHGRPSIPSTLALRPPSADWDWNITYGDKPGPPWIPSQRLFHLHPASSQLAQISAVLI